MSQINELAIATRKAGLNKLKEFAPRAGRDYAARRNFDFGPNKHHNVSCLSPYTRYRLISEQEIAKQVLASHSLSECEKYISEVCWRTYWKGWLEHHPSVWFGYLSDVNELMAECNYDQAIYKRALDAKTGLDCFDFWLHELKDTGYLHNHARMWFASIWIHTLGLPWQLGAEFFLRHLIDGDPASNTLSWRWVAGLHTKGKSYLARADNIQTYTNGRFNPDPALLARHPKTCLETREIKSHKTLSHVPNIPPKPCDAFVIWPDDLSIEYLDTLNIASHIALIDPSWEAKQASYCQLVSTFRAKAIEDVTLRIKQTYGLDASLIGSHEQFRDWITNNKIKSISWYRPFVGYGQSLSESLKQDFSEIELIELRKTWDALFFPHANKGFFNLKKAIPSVLSNLELGN